MGIGVKKVSELLLSVANRIPSLGRFSFYRELKMLLGEWAYRSFYIREQEDESKGLNDYCNSLRKSDALYILGSGYSINQVSPEQWEEISQHDSIGFNYFILHSFVPNFYFFETPVNNDLFEVFKTVYLEKKPAYTSVPVFINNIHKHEAGKKNADYDFIGRVFFYNPVCIRTFRLHLLSFLAGCVDKFRKKRKQPYSYLMHHSGTLSILLDFAYLSGYKQIYLLGFDMTDPRYFYHEYSSASAKALLNYIEQASKKQSTSAPHLTINKEHNRVGGLLPLDTYVVFFFKKFMKRKKVEVYVNTPLSPLGQYFPEVRWNRIDVCKAG